MKKLTFLTIVMLLIFSVPVNAVSNESYGYGYKKQYNEMPPDLGFYGPLIEKYNGLYLGDEENRMVYLTFDSGYEQGYTEQILDVLNEKDVPATFFLTGHYVDDQPELVKRKVEEGHIIGNHSNDHLDYTKVSDDKVKEDLKVLDDKIINTTDQEVVKFFRPAKGIFSERTLKLTDELGYTNIFWTVALVDWNRDENKGWKHAFDEVLRQVHPGAIILLHAVTEDNAEALGYLIDELRDQDYEFGSLDDLVWHHSVPIG
ncbi:polysaccharide deacetylase family protein [Alkalibacillus haloalkaliphilus]|uniref:polysaccharide deacetylase family protein n=1 Tax=Alkalibacillus haloalkaliphilus TaxID=94136 RepID=UPI0002D64CDA|nr:polysaccharide deacetylase family protein [Alkalibacillus haloalkaliphilus]